VLLLAARIAAGVVGALAIYVALLLSEKEEQALDKWLEQRWRALRMAERPMSEWLREALITAFKLVHDGFAALFGARLLSVRGVCFSLALSSSSQSLAALTRPGIDLGTIVVSLFFGVGPLLGIRWATHEEGSRRPLVVLGLSVVPTSVLLLAAEHLSMELAPPGFTAMVLMGLCIGYTWDVVFYVAARKTFNSVVRGESGVPLLLGTALGLGGLGILGVLPGSAWVTADRTVAWPLFFAARSNGWTFMCSVSVLVIATLLILHRLLHPLLATRIADRLRRTDAAKRGKVLLAIGGASIAWAASPSWFGAVVKALEKLL
jgi:hypothetical protein